MKQMKTYTREYFIEKGRQGGIATAKKYSKRTRQKWGRLGGQNNRKLQNAKMPVNISTEIPQNPSV